MKWIRQLLCPHFWVELETTRTYKYGVLIGWHVNRCCTRCERIERNEWNEWVCKGKAMRSVANDPTIFPTPGKWSCVQ